MGRLVKEIKIAGDKGYITVKALFDTGYDDSYIRSDIANKISTVEDLGDKYSKILLGNNEVITANNATKLKLEIAKDCIIKEEFRVLDNLNEDMIIGHKVLQNRQIVLDMSNDTVNVKNCRIYSRL